MIDRFRNKWSMLGTLVFVQTTGAFALYTFAPLSPFLIEDFELSRADYGTLVTGLYLGEVLFMFFMGSLTDLFDLRIFFTGGLFLAGFSLLAISFVQSYVILFAIFFVLGISYTGISPGTNKALIEWFEADALATPLGIKQAGLPGGIALGGFIVPSLCKLFSWPLAVRMLSVFFLLSGVFAWVAYRSPTERIRPTMKQSRFRPFENISVILKFFRNQGFSILIVLGFFFTMFQLTLTSFFVPMYQDLFLLGEVLAGMYLGMSQSTGALTRVVAGYVVDTWFGGNPKWLLVVMGISSAFLLWVLVWLPASVPGWFLLTLTVLLGCASLGWMGLYFTALLDFVGEEYAGVGSGLGVTVNLSGGLVGPPLFGYASEVMGGSYVLSITTLSLVMVLVTSLFAVFAPAFVQETGNKARAG